MSGASSFASMMQHLGISLGVGVAALTLHLSMTLRDGSALTVNDVAAGFMIIGLLCAVSVFYFMHLAPTAGIQLNRRKIHSDRT